MRPRRWIEDDTYRQVLAGLEAALGGPGYQTIAETKSERMTDILMPALSPTMEEGTLAKWHVKAGDTVKAGDVIAEIETDKATMEVEAVDEGVVEEILVAEGTEGVKVNTPIARLSGGGRRAPLRRRRPPNRPRPRPRLPKPAPAAAAPRRARQGRAARPPPRLHRSPATASSPRPWPAVWRSRSGIDLSAIKGSGPHGRIVKPRRRRRQPRARARPGRRCRPPRRPSRPRKVQSLAQMGIPDGSYDLIPLDGMRKTIARRMTDSFRDVPHFPLTIDSRSTPCWPPAPRSTPCSRSRASRSRSTTSSSRPPPWR